MTDIDQLIRHLRLEPLPTEGGYFRQTWSSEDLVTIPGYDSPRPAGSAIYYLLTADPDSFSAMHRLASGEMYHFYLGDPVEMLLLSEGSHGRRVILGPGLFGGQNVQYFVPRNVWQGSRLIRGGQFALLGTTMAPGFDALDFTIGHRQKLVGHFPDHAGLISALTRE
jgi:predicted cupin superfamily sugar epimerase